MVIEVAKAQDDEVGDGTTTAVVLVGSLMEQAEQLITKKIHPTVIAQGYQMGMEKALEIISDLSTSIDPYDQDILLKIADTAMTGKSIESVKKKLNGIVVDAVMMVAEEKDGKVMVDDDNITIKKQAGNTMDDAELSRGVVRQDPVYRGYATQGDRCKDCTCCKPDGGYPPVKAKIRSAPALNQCSRFRNVKPEETGRAVIDSGNVLFCQKGIAVQWAITLRAGVTLLSVRKGLSRALP